MHIGCSRQRHHNMFYVLSVVAIVSHRFANASLRSRFIATRKNRYFTIWQKKHFSSFRFFSVIFCLFSFNVKKTKKIKKRCKKNGFALQWEKENLLVQWRESQRIASKPPHWRKSRIARINNTTFTDKKLSFAFSLAYRVQWVKRAQTMRRRSSELSGENELFIGRLSLSVVRQHRKSIRQI